MIRNIIWGMQENWSQIPEKMCIEMKRNMRHVGKVEPDSFQKQRMSVIINRAKSKKTMGNILDNWIKWMNQ